jgi:hypothetical protein
MNGAEVKLPQILPLETMEVMMQVLQSVVPMTVFLRICVLTFALPQIEDIGSAAVWSHLLDCMSRSIHGAFSVLHWTGCLDDSFPKERFAVLKRLRAM